MNADLGRIHSWGRKWNINFEPTKCHALCVSLKKDVGFHPPVFMDTLSIAEVDVLKVLGIYFDCKLTWSYMIDQLATRSRQRLGAVYCVGNILVRVVLLSLLNLLLGRFVSMVTSFLWEHLPLICVS